MKAIMSGLRGPVAVGLVFVSACALGQHASPASSKTPPADRQDGNRQRAGR